MGYIIPNQSHSIKKEIAKRQSLSLLGIATSCDEKLPGYIHENIFYCLAMKAKNETAERFREKRKAVSLPLAVVPSIVLR